jgi:hypothetical protein
MFNYTKQARPKHCSPTRKSQLTLFKLTGSLQATCPDTFSRSDIADQLPVFMSWQVVRRTAATWGLPWVGVKAVHQRSLLGTAMLAAG